MQKPCQHGKSFSINQLIIFVQSPGRQKKPLWRRHPAKNSCSGYLRKYPLTIRA